MNLKNVGRGWPRLVPRIALWVGQRVGLALLRIWRLRKRLPGRTRECSHDRETDVDFDATLSVHSRGHQHQGEQEDRDGP
jgi:hypothetical protein